jgi:hypothetical protein
VKGLLGEGLDLRKQGDKYVALYKTVNKLFAADKVTARARKEQEDVVKATADITEEFITATMEETVSRPGCGGRVVGVSCTARAMQCARAVCVYITRGVWRVSLHFLRLEAHRHTGVYQYRSLTRCLCHNPPPFLVLDLSYESTSMSGG